VFDITHDGLQATELAPDVLHEEVRMKTGCHVDFASVTAAA